MIGQNQNCPPKSSFHQNHGVSKAVIKLNYREHVQGYLVKGEMDRANVKKIMILFIDLSALDARFEKC